jgi:hypothetical protein
LLQLLFRFGPQVRQEKEKRVALAEEKQQLFLRFGGGGIKLVARVSERTIPTERPPLVGDVSAKFCGKRMTGGQCSGSLRLYSRISSPQPLLFISSIHEAEWTPFQTHYFSVNLVVLGI